ASAERCARLLEPAKCGGDLGEVVGALPGEPEPARTTLEETHAQLVLQRPDLTADGRRGDAELVGGECEALVAPGSLEHAQSGKRRQVPVHQPITGLAGGGGGRRTAR